MMNRTYRNVVNLLNPTSRFPPLKSSIESLCNAKRLTGALRLAFDNPIEADYTIYSNIIQLCIDLKAHKQGRLVHSHLITNGFPSNVHLGTKLIILYTMSGDMVSARKMFDKLPERNVVSWTALLSGYSQNGYSKEALDVFVAMRREGVRANQFTYGSVLRACTSVSCMTLGNQIQGCIQKSRFVDNLYVQSALVDFNSKCGEMEDAFCIFESMAERDLVSWNVMISGYAFRGYSIDAFLLFRWMFRQGILPDCFTLGSVLKASVGSGKCCGLVKISMIHGCIIRLGYGSFSIISGALVDAYVKCGNLANASYIYKKMQNKDMISCTALITGYAREGKNINECLELFCQLHRNHREIDSIILCSMISICANTASLSLGRQLHAIAIKYKSTLDVAMSNALVDMYAKTGEIEDANNVFQHMTEKNVISWTSMISAYGMHGRGVDAVSYFKKMECEGFEPNDITFLSLLFACSHNGLTAEGWECFSKMVRKYKIVPRDEHYSCLVDIFARSGCLNESYDLICTMNIKPSASLWGSVLGACSIHGNMDLGKVAAKHLCNIEPTNAVSYVVLASMYSAAGLWDSAWKARDVVQTRRLPKDPGYSLFHSGNDMVALLPAG
ncbi:pentatricopeptide repeat-containing protein At3g20730-like [Solanum dulcamara]|uniref:pentatricopeptide repeat-containing protein At3g20730-like n=1 Tax=Solanum dulcamara TaxID=45834 RepID=UPI0024863D46|nr:pentatricopeptide repeat-containing protein At3g20730-like [Solanum dulcamara]XP_055805838.1 pentatricopeptide repeat-containing protein At3g20730-like [Solanum dulcamara]XP_055805839.1 pentatricopeptide repeat-containing protein At3g20730-like [Solanum dulcamara]XP_055805840.1 pentatricopeptide repeat-containing protein At3g20730-like [Solanum dulcamara]XP_055805841.1 pentatricopeptide repeat-containing protein At3g20730-like [Solanum dulcamara]XP_055805843.1 pentatricopeptide repeat-conta